MLFRSRAAAGDRLELPFGQEDSGAEPGAMTEGKARRVAALHLIGRRNLPVFRSTLDIAFADPDARVRLAAAEAMSPPWRTETLRAVVSALGRERHPVVAQGLVRALLAMLKSPPADLPAEERAAIVDVALDRFGQCGWQTDMDLLDVVAAFPHKTAIPVLIEALDQIGRAHV